MTLKKYKTQAMTWGERILFGIGILAVFFGALNGFFELLVNGITRIMYGYLLMAVLGLILYQLIIWGESTNEA